MNYTEFKKNLKDLTLKYQREREKVNDMIKNVQKEHERGIISEHEAKEQEKKLYGILDTLKGKEKRSVERLKMNFAMQDNPVEIGIYRTFYTDRSMTPRQLRDVKSFRKFADEKIKEKK